ncbi:hypothetical protein SDC9_33105 [bioreactor metagenome]|uniref:KilA-N domain-containing protein n=1 Tax=bioreactor metagenome TaxID=1076179 RepID=A0A644V7E2_9ZZZZ
MGTKICLFEESPITFALSKENGVMINATEMAKAFNTDVFQFTRIDSTKSFIQACLKPQICGLLEIEGEEDLIISKQKSGTYMHRILALKFAAWLSPEFEVWVYSTIEQLLFGKHVEREKSMERTIALQKELSDIKDKSEKTGTDFERYLEIERQLTHERALRKSLTSESISEMKNIFD